MKCERRNVRCVGGVADKLVDYYLWCGGAENGK